MEGAVKTANDLLQNTSTARTMLEQEKSTNDELEQLDTSNFSFFIFISFEKNIKPKTTFLSKFRENP